MGEEKKSFYITPTLLSSFEYYFNSDFEETEEEEDGKSETNLKDKVFNDFLNTLRKIKTPPPEAIIRGINFENDVRIYAETGLLPSIDDNNKENRIEAIQTIGNIVKGGLWQVVLQKEITLNNRKLGLDNTTFLLYGKADVIKENIIYDVKTTSSYDIGKYTNSPQHLLYMLCSNIPNFSYLICEGERNFYREDYTMEDMKEIQSKIESKINNFIFFLRNANLFGDYEKYWDRKYK